MTEKPLDRRSTLAIIGGAGATLFLSGESQTTQAQLACTPQTPTVTEGPYWVEEKLFRSDIRTDPATGIARPGLPLNLTINVQDLEGASCGPLAGALVDIWHCDAGGLYSDVSANNTAGQKFLRGYQVSDDSGQVRFLTVYPGWYQGRTIHIHVRVRTYAGATVLSNFVTQLFFDDTINDIVMAQAPYNSRGGTRDTRNTNDNVYTPAANASRMLVSLVKTSIGYDATITLGAPLNTAVAVLPAVGQGGVGSAASGAAGIAPGSWISIYGTNLAAASRVATSSDLILSHLPFSLGGISVSINNKAAFMHFISANQINVLAPPDTTTGLVPVTVTNSAGTSVAVSANLQPVLPAFFVVSNYVRALRASDHALVVTAKIGETIEIYGTGFGPTSAPDDPGLVFSGGYPTNNAVTVTIGNVSAPVLFAGLVGAGLYQVNVTIPPGLANGDHQVIATVLGVTSAQGALLKVG
jgi:uncharacterized protein (TIGR03437 family)